MARRLPPRPDLHQLRKQAKALLAALHQGDPTAVTTFRDHLPAAAGASREQVLAAGYRLADAQSALARRTGFASWPQLGRHIETLRALEGTWSFQTLVLGGQTVPTASLGASRLHIDGDRFRTETPEAVYEGEFDLDVAQEPYHLDLHFVAGPEAGATNRAIFRLHGDALEICLDPAGGPRPASFASPVGTALAHERLLRIASARPQGVTGGTPPPPAVPAAPAAPLPYVPSPLLTALQGPWSAVAIERDGQALPAGMCRTAVRTMHEHEVTIAFGGQVMLRALVRLDPERTPVPVDYQLVGGPTPGAQQLGLFAWRGDDACFCMGAPGGPRPLDFTCAPGSGRTLSVWRRQRLHRGGA